MAECAELQYYPFIDQGPSFIPKLSFEVNPSHFFCPTSIILHVVWLCVYVFKLCTVHGLFHVETSVALM